MWVGLVKRIRTKLSNTASSSRRSRSKQQDGERSCRRTFSFQIFTSDYLKLPHLCFDKTTHSIIQVEIVRMTSDAFWSEKSTICQRNISPLAPRVCSGGECSSDREA